ncbi:hypothetical protein BKA70DRAFT_1342006 [Coprinopsis sp. MPI-PUGE-AT-0042]|nr:hypothetical protein BKA70DRAFT_1342006 [Coprinopsis sp. MPI-PUGE-AT-0042]
MSGHLAPRASAGYAKVRLCSTKRCRIIAAARSGNISAVEQLFSILGTDFGLRHIHEALAIYLAFLDSSLIPNFSDIGCGDPEAIGHATRGLHSIYGLQHLLRTVSTSRLPMVERLTLELAASLVRKLDHIVSWYGFHLNPLSNINPYASRTRSAAYLDNFALFLIELVCLSPVVANAVWENNGTQDLIVDMWFFQNGDMDPSALACLSDFKKDDYFLNITEATSHIEQIRCSILSIMQQALRHDNARPRMMAKLFRHRQSDGEGQIDSHVQLARTILSRIEQIQSRVECGQCPAGYALKGLGILCEIVTTLTRRVESDDPLIGPTSHNPLVHAVNFRKLYHSLYKEDYTGLATSTLLSISNKALADETAVHSTHSDHPTYLAVFIFITLLFPQLDPEPDSHGKWRFRSMLDNGALKIIANAASVWHRSPPSFTEAEEDHQFDSLVMFEFLLPFHVSAFCHPSLVYSSHRAFHALSREQWDYLNQSCSVAAGEQYPDSDARRDWAAEFKRQSSQRLDLFKTFRTSWRSMLCDSETHYLHIDVAPELQRYARRCTGCFSMVYCSEACQKADWDHRHRDECPSRRHVPLKPEDREMDTRLVCSPRTRAWHIHFLQDFIRNGGWAEMVLEVANSSAKSSISRLSFNCTPFNVESIALAEYHPRRFSSEDAIEDAFSRHFLQWTPPRMIERQDDSRIHFRLVEAVFGFGVPDIVALVMVKLCICEPASGSDNAFTAICMDSITRIGPHSRFVNPR